MNIGIQTDQITPAKTSSVWTAFECVPFESVDDEDGQVYRKKIRESNQIVDTFNWITVFPQ